MEVPAVKRGSMLLRRWRSDDSKLVLTGHLRDRIACLVVVEAEVVVVEVSVAILECALVFVEEVAALQLAFQSP